MVGERLGNRPALGQRIDLRVGHVEVAKLDPSRLEVVGRVERPSGRLTGGEFFRDEKLLFGGDERRSINIEQRISLVDRLSLVVGVELLEPALEFERDITDERLGEGDGADR